MDRATRKQLDEVIRWQTQILRDFDPAVRAAQLAAIQPVEITQAFKNYQQFTNTIRDSGLFSAMEAARVASQTMANMLVDFDDIVSSAITAFVESGSLFYEQGRLIRQLPSFLDLERLRKSLERNARDTLDSDTLNTCGILVF